MRRFKARKFHALTCLGAVAHHALELGAGVGLVFQPELGLPGAWLFWGTVLPLWFKVAVRGSPRWDRPLALAAGASLAGAGIHFVIWPWKVRRGLPVLTEAEGLGPEYLPAYNAVLYAWAVAALLALAVDTEGKSRRWATAGLLGGGLFFPPSARYHFRWIREEARTNPAWWNRGVAGR